MAGNSRIFKTSVLNEHVFFLKNLTTAFFFWPYLQRKYIFFEVSDATEQVKREVPGNAAVSFESIIHNSLAGNVEL